MIRVAILIKGLFLNKKYIGSIKYIPKRIEIKSLEMFDSLKKIVVEKYNTEINGNLIFNDLFLLLRKIEATKLKRKKLIE